MPQLILNQIEEVLVDKLKQRADLHGVSVEEEHRQILKDALLPPLERRSFTDYLLAMPNVGEDEDFERGRQIDRPITL
jgi:plasmid stability protein